MASQFEWSNIQPPEIIESSRKYILNEDLLPALVKYMGVKKGDRLVDLGCGPGTLTRYLAKRLGRECQVTGVDSDKKYIEYAAEIALEHHLGLTCDPVKGYVQIPCIERNAMSCKRALDCAQFALLTDGNHYIKLDDAIQTMVETGKDLHHKYRETSEGGLAKIK